MASTPFPPAFIHAGRFSLRELNSQVNEHSIGRGETQIVIFGFRVGIGPVFAGYASNRAAARGRPNGNKVLQNKIRNLALFSWWQRTNFVQNGLGFCAHHLNFASPA
jgi:hypothetical protein